MKKKILIITLILFGFLIVYLSLPSSYDTDDTYSLVAAQYKNEYFLLSFDNKTSCENETDGLGTIAVPFGVKAEGCHASWFVFLNLFVFQTSGEPIPLK